MSKAAGERAIDTADVEVLKKDFANSKSSFRVAKFICLMTQLLSHTAIIGKREYDLHLN